MKKAITAALLSGLVFPGFGQFYLGKKKAGFAFIIATNIGLVGFIWSLALRIPLILEKIKPELDKGTLDLDQLVELILRYTGMGSGSLLEQISLIIMVGSWIWSIGDAFETGRKLGRNTDAGPEKDL